MCDILACLSLAVFGTRTLAVLTIHGGTAKVGRRGRTPLSAPSPVCVCVPVCLCARVLTWAWAWSCGLAARYSATHPYGTHSYPPWSWMCLPIFGV